VLIRDGRLTSARVHVPLSDNYHLRKDYGTRHRAAIGASEMGDAIAVVVSEERGCISLALEGRLYTLDNADALRTLLHKLLSPARTGVSLSSIGSLIRTGMRQSRRKTDADDPSQSGAAAGKTASASGPAMTDRARRPVGRVTGRISRKQRILLMIASLAIAIALWLYVQVTVNPVDSKTYVVNLETINMGIAEKNGFDLQIPLSSIQVTLQGRKKTISDLTTADITAYIDLAGIDAAGLAKLDVMIKTNGLVYLKQTLISPAQVTVNVLKKTSG
jgi:diadenylate cyclase